MSVIETVEIAVCNNCGSTDSEVVTTSKDYEFECCDNEFVFVECSHCGLVWLKNRPVMSALPIIYSSEYSTYNYDEYLGGLINWARNQVQKLKVRAFSKYLESGSLLMDIGCGNGALLRMLQKFGDPSWTLVGVDFSDDSISSLEEFNLTGVKALFETMEWNGAPPSVIVMNQVLEHFEDPQRVLEKAFETLAPGGVLVVETPSLDGWDTKWFREHHWGGWHTPRHWHLFTEKTLRESMERHGLEVVETTYLLNPYAWLQSIRFRLLDKYGLKRLSNIFQVNVFPAVVAVSCLDIVQKLVRRRTSNMRMIGMKPTDDSIPTGRTP